MGEEFGGFAECSAFEMALDALFEGGIERDGHGGIVTLGLDAVGWHPRSPTRAQRARTNGAPRTFAALGWATRRTYIHCCIDSVSTR